MNDGELIEQRPDIFDRIMSWKIFKKIEPFYKKNKEMLLYLFFGFCTTLVAFVAFAAAVSVIELPEISLFGRTINTSVQVSNIISWVCGVIFAYVTNRIWVFSSKVSGAKAIAKECAAFCAGRLFTLVVENILLNLCVESFGIGEMVAKIIVSVVTIILNYVISKLIVFRKKA
ncbi:MAG: GtrA family protein [Oscillospiraceae bacterium]